MKCPLCESTSYYKNGRCNEQQNYLCKNCGKQFFEPSLPHSLEGELLANSNEHTKVSMTDAAEVSLVKNLPEEKITDKGLGSFNFKLAEELLQTILSPDSDWLGSSVFSQLILKIQHNNEIKHKLETGISILILDAENLKLDINSELFLASLCKYPLKVKIAFAN